MSLYSISGCCMYQISRASTWPNRTRNPRFGSFGGPGAFPSSRLDSHQNFEQFGLGYIDFRQFPTRFVPKSTGTPKWGTSFGVLRVPDEPTTQFGVLRVPDDPTEGRQPSDVAR